MKQAYIKPVCEPVSFDKADIVRTSGWWGPTTPPDSSNPGSDLDFKPGDIPPLG